GGDIRITIHQNLVFRWVDPAVLPALYTAIRDAGLVTRGAETISDITACPGADTCRLGITSAKGLATALNKALENGMSTYRETARKLKIKISGCPNGCAQHTTSNIGFQGAALAKDGRRVPAEMVFVGGALLGEETRLADSILKIPTRNAPKVVKKLIDVYISERKDDEEHFDLVMKRLGKDHLKGELEELTAIPAYEDAPEFYQDWGHEDQKFDIMTGIKGECAGATVEDKVPDFEAAEKALQQAEAHFMHEDYEVAMLEAYHAMADAAHVPLYSKLVDPFTPAQTTWEFENLFVRTGEVDAKWMDIHEKLEEMVVSEATKERASEMIDWAKEFYEVCREAELQLKNKATA
ncbi:hypothetical protein QLX67_11380, partial [Balneolaceae bacterium ANBcel3]|nr:hypothetical protein [Balneolaceae bacterium ANBcel3]